MTADLRLAVLAAHALTVEPDRGAAWAIAETEPDEGPLREQCDRVAARAGEGAWPSVG